jgi:phosphate transport system substrate-binding protein
MSPNVRRSLSAAAAAALAAALAGPARADPPLRASGTGTALGAMRRIADAFAKASPGDRLEVLPSIGTNGAVRAVAHGALEVGLIGRSLEPAEKALGLVGLPYARTPFVFVAGPRSGVSGVTEEEVVRIYRGATSAWPTGERVRVVLRPKADADTRLLRAISPALAAAVDAAFAREGMLMAATNQECDAVVAKTPGAFGPTSLSQVVAEGEPLRPLAWNGVAPTAANLGSGAYPLAKTLEIVVRASPSPGVRRFLAFLRTDEARKILVETGNLPLALPPSE